ncbi:MAG: hypothetical protein ACTHN5_19160 [Phycisphaerae bacterium]
MQKKKGVCEWTTVVEFRIWRPEDRASLRDWLWLCLGLEMPETPVCDGHNTPLDYLCHSFFEQEGDAVVWACRGGGKTMVGAAATLLDLLFKPGIEVRILGGSFEQSEKMFRYLRGLVGRGFEHLLKETPTQRRLELINGSRVEVLAQSDRSVRGQRVQKLRCDEVELFDEGVWQAAQLTTRGEKGVRGAVEAFSTMHRPAGLMSEVLEKSAASGRKVFSWCVWDVLEKCPERRKCEGCPLWEECQGRAKVERAGGNGFVRIADVIAMKKRVSRATWEHEMLCHRPRVERAVFPAFRRETHVRSAAGVSFVRGATVVVDGRSFRVEGIFAGVDFGYRGAFVCLWMAMMRAADAADAPPAVWVVEEMVVREETLPRNAKAMRDRPWDVEKVYCDVAGRGVNAQTGHTDERVLKEEGFVVKSRKLGILEGVSLVADLVHPAIGAARLFVDPRCVQLISAMEGYERGKNGEPLKDGTHDHLVDALRYAVANHLGVSSKLELRVY